MQNIQSQIKSLRSYASSIASLIDSTTTRKRKALHQNHYIRSCKKQKVAVEELVVSSQGIAKVVKNSKKKKKNFMAPFLWMGVQLPQG